jgi:hypothetical protein
MTSTVAGGRFTRMSATPSPPALQLAAVDRVDDAGVRERRHDAVVERVDGVLEAQRPVGDLRDRRQQREALAVATHARAVASREAREHADGADDADALDVRGRAEVVVPERAGRDERHGDRADRGDVARSGEQRREDRRQHDDADDRVGRGGPDVDDRQRRGDHQARRERENMAAGPGQPAPVRRRRHRAILRFGAAA